ncbi:M20 family metallopeptidase [Neobacillus niacini]|uniref:M20 family metallopeptidase n=1 Tax=Neobacillus niacini TaxID=86668 RepID=UPI0005F00CF5|nr:M20 family metallopeptidase [Neobacillus niacini]
MDFAQSISEKVEGKRQSYIHISDEIWNYAETKYTEHKSSEILASKLEEEGFKVERSVGGIPTAFTATFGSGFPVVAILGEYDALFHLSQEKSKTEWSPVVPEGNGHGCGHNLLGTASLAAAITIKEILEEETLSGTVRYYGCPAEEGGGGKGYMVKAGLFADVDAAITWHPSTQNGVMSFRMLATSQHYFTFKGKSSHAGVTPHLGRSALDAMQLMNVGANYLREHLIQDTRLHYAITNTGGNSANVVQSEAQVLYKLRGPNLTVVNDMLERVQNIAKGAALMTGCEVIHSFDAGSSDITLNQTLEKVMNESFIQLGVPIFNSKEQDFAAEIRKTFTQEEMVSKGEKSLADTILPYSFDVGIVHGSSDVGDVSWIVPTVQCRTACFALDTPFHTWQVVSQGTTSIAHKGMLHAAKVMGLTAVELLLHPETVIEAKEEHQKKLAKTPYISPIPDTSALPKEVVSIV